MALSLPVCFPLLTSKLPSGHDTFFYHPRLVEFHQNIVDGILLPRWAPDLSFGGGQPLFLFSPPLPYYMAEVWHLLGVDTVLSFNFAAVVTVIFSAVFMFLFAEHHFGKKAGWLAAAAYVYAPYFHVDIFVRHAFAELLAFPFFPLSLYGFSRYARENNLRFLLLGSGALCGILISHNPSALLFSPFLLLFLAFLCWKNRSLSLFFRMLIGIVVGVALAAFVWAPTIAEMKFVYIERTLQATTNYLDHFVYPQQLFSPVWGYGLSIAGSADRISFSFGWGHLLLIAAAAWLTFRDRNRTLTAWFIFLGCNLVMVAVMMTPAARFVWEYVPLLKQVQFPWRLLAPGILITAILAALFGRLIADRAHSAIWFWSAMGILILPNLSHIGSEKYYPIVDRQWTPLAIAENGIETTASGEFEPRWVKQRAAFSSERARLMSGSGTVSANQNSPTSWSMETNSATETVVESAVLYFPGWGVSVDDSAVPIQIAESGRIQFHVPAGNHRVTMEFRRTPVRLISELVSLSTLVIVVGLAIFKS